MDKVLFGAGMLAVLINVVFGNAQDAELATFGVGLIFAVGFSWIYSWMGV